MELDSYYKVLGVSTDSSDDQIRRAYRKLAMQWHPDKWTRNSSLVGEAKRKFQQIQEAYSVLSDQGKRAMYDAGLYDPHDDEEEFADFLQEMTSLMKNSRAEERGQSFCDGEEYYKERNYSLGDLQSMFWEMAQSFDSPEYSDAPHETTNESPQYSWSTSPLDDSRTSKKARSDTNSGVGDDFRFHLSGFASGGMGQFCT